MPRTIYTTSPAVGRTRARTATLQFPLTALPSPSGSSRFSHNTVPKLEDFRTNFAQPPVLPVFSDHELQFQRNQQPQLPRPPPQINAKLRKLQASKSAKYSNASGAQYSSSQSQTLAYPRLKSSKLQGHSKLLAKSQGQLDKDRNTSGQVEVDAGQYQPVSSDTLHLDGQGLKQFPILGPNDRNIRLLSLQHNSISRLQNLIVLGNLVVLDLYSNKIERIASLQEFSNLRVLLLGKNSIRRVEGLEGLRQLEILDLHGNQLRYLDNLHSLAALRILNVAGNVIRSIRNFGPSELSSLTELNLKRNRLRSLNGLEKATNLKKLFVSNNELQCVSTLNPLRKLIFLEELVLESNPLCSVSNYTYAVLSLLPTLAVLDRVLVSDSTRKEVKFWQMGHQRLLDVQHSTNAREIVEVPRQGSREEVINQARRRWESVIDFVKNTAKYSPESNNTSKYSLPSKNTATYDMPTSIPRLRSKSEPRQLTQDSRHFQNYTPTSGSYAKHYGPVSTKAEPSPQNETKSDTNLVPSRSVGADEGTAPSRPKFSKVAIVRPRLRRSEQAGTEVAANIHTSEIPVSTLSKSDILIKTSDLARTNPEMDMDMSRAQQICQHQPQKVQNFQTFHEKVELQSPECEKPLEMSKSKETVQIAAASEIAAAAEMDADAAPNTSENVLEEKPVVLPIRKNRKVSIQRSFSVDTSLPIAEESSSVGTFSAPNVFAMSASSGKRRSSLYRPVVRKRGQTAKVTASPSLSSPNLSFLRRPMTGIPEADLSASGKSLKRVNSMSSLATPAIEQTPREAIKKQGADYLLELEGKTLNVFGHGALKYFLTMCFPDGVAESVETIKFHFLVYDAIFPHFGKLRQSYPSAERFHFRANNIETLGQLNGLADLHGITALQIDSEGNPVTQNPLWEKYALYRLGHWGLREMNTKLVDMTLTKSIFDPLGYLALSCLPQSTLSPLAKKLHALQTFCSCSQSNSSQDSGRKKGENSDSWGDWICNTWDNDPVLLDVIGKEALVYVPENVVLSSAEIASKVVNQGSDVLQKLEMLDQSLLDTLERTIESVLLDFTSMDDLLKKEYQKVKNVSIIASKKLQ